MNIANLQVCFTELILIYISWNYFMDIYLYIHKLLTVRFTSRKKILQMCLHRLVKSFLSHQLFGPTSSNISFFLAIFSQFLSLVKSKMLLSYELPKKLAIDMIRNFFPFIYWRNLHSITFICLLSPVISWRLQLKLQTLWSE